MTAINYALLLLIPSKDDFGDFLETTMGLLSSCGVIFAPQGEISLYSPKIRVSLRNEGDLKTMISKLKSEQRISIPASLDEKIWLKDMHFSLNISSRASFNESGVGLPSSYQMLGLHIDGTYFWEDTEEPAHPAMDHLVSFARKLYLKFKASYAICDQTLRFSGEDPVYSELKKTQEPRFPIGAGFLINAIQGKLSHVFWLNLFGPELSKKIPPERWNTLPYGEAQKLQDGGVLYLLGKNPYHVGEDLKDKVMSGSVEYRCAKHLFGTRDLQTEIRYLLDQWLFHSIGGRVKDGEAVNELRRIIVEYSDNKNVLRDIAHEAIEWERWIAKMDRENFDEKNARVWKLLDKADLRYRDEFWRKRD